MTLQEIRDACQTTTYIEKGGKNDGLVTVCTSLTLRVECQISPYAVRDSQEYESVKKEVIRTSKERILHQLYEDCRREIFDATNEFMSCDRYDFIKIQKTQDRLMAAARYQKPEEK